ncbi:helix-turn-helix domain-containing protein [Flavobacterium acetivorans]|uniref:helix-turn-helix domain-containing protein n=1 Tax=Flavobacterium acetivorans TaxID=2893883 RepID=UPI001E38CC80|nr:AraC family transcriptional regulator [Flavobacterium sp. F-29]UFH36681.1 AraC family transcriptional regulator [Flavobacterium sp. F-29]
MKLYIKNMVCNRCVMVVKSELKKFGLHPVSVELGEVEISEDLEKEKEHELNEQLLVLGFEIIDDKKKRIVEKVKNLIVELVHLKDNRFKTNLSDYLVAAIGNDYSYISNLFSLQEVTTIEQYYILQKIERVKELLVYDELSLNEIAFELNYSSASHLSKQFKKVTGLTPTYFKTLKEQKRQPLENL